MLGFFRWPLSKFTSYAVINRKIVSLTQQFSSVSHNFYNYAPSTEVNKILTRVTALKIEVDFAQATIDNDLKATIQRKLKLH